VQLTLDLPASIETVAEADGVGRTAFFDESCPSCRQRPVALRSVSTRVLECRMCRALLSSRPAGLVVAVPADRRLKRGIDLLRGARQ
jgi:hypothetical protein